MITTSDIKLILFDDLKAMGIETFTKENLPQGRITAKRIVIVVGREVQDVIWNTTSVNINFLVPDLDENGTADEITLQEIQREVRERYNSACGDYDGSNYIYERESDEVLEGNFCHFVNLRLTFQVLNVK